eukprot:403376793
MVSGMAQDQKEMLHYQREMQHYQREIVHELRDLRHDIREIFDNIRGTVKQMSTNLQKISREQKQIIGKVLHEVSHNNGQLHKRSKNIGIKRSAKLQVQMQQQGPITSQMNRLNQAQPIRARNVSATTRQQPKFVQVKK